MNLRQSIFTFIVFISSILTLVAQCDITLGAPILDNSTGSIEIVIDGAINDDLSNIDQGLCGVELFFEHVRIADISISLESPSGQSVVLVGPATGVGGLTQFTYWGVEFIPCDSTAMTDDPILEDIFSTEDNWGAFGNYNGQYYPQQGCLEDFDTGPVNGIWTLNFEDVAQFDIGAIDSIKLIFCDSTNIYCQECFANGGTLAAVDSDYCESDPNLNLDIDPEFETEPPVDLYSYNYLIVQAGEVIGANEEPNLTGYNFGTYQICGVSSLTDQTDDILDDVIGTDYGDLPNLFMENSYCADLSMNCIAINIIEIPDTILTIDTICTGDVLILDGIEFSETGEYVISFSASFCDSVSILNLLVIDNQANIVADSDAISCSDGDVLLDATTSIMSPTTVRNWFKVDGVLDPSIVGDDMITVTEEGVYGLSLITGICSDTSYIEIFNDESIPSFTFDVDTLSCYDLTVTIDMTSSVALDNIFWSGPVTSGIEDILVGVSGMYYVEGVAFNGCIGRDSVFVAEDFNVPTPIIMSDTITCAIDTATITTILPDSLSFVYIWNGPNIVGGSAAGDYIKVTKDTTYALSLQNLGNGCIEEFNYTVLIDTNRTNFAIQSTLLDCNFPISEITVSPAIDTIDYQWYFEGQQYDGVGDSIFVDIGGDYELFTTTSNGCMDTFMHTVAVDTLLPVVSTNNAIFSCLMDSIQLTSSSLETDLTYSWNGPGDYESTEESPFIYNPGIYVLWVTAPSGCSDYVVSDVESGAGLPDVSFTPSDTLDCNVDIISLIPSDTVNLAFEWQSALITDVSAFIVDVEYRTNYAVLITDTISGCNLVFDVYAPGDYELPIPEVDFLSIDCNNSMVTLSTSFSVEIDSLRWNSDFGFTSIEQSPVVSQSGDYYLTAYGANGCNHTETVSLLENEDSPIISVEVPLLDCLNPSVDISFNTLDVTDILNIRLPNGDLFAGSALTITEPNTYMAIATSLSGCVDSMIMDVLQDTIAPEVSLMTLGQINCTETTTTIFVDNPEEGLIYDWTGVSIISPLGLDSIVVDAEGLYNLVVTDTANCITIQDINIESSTDFPLVSSSVDTINCTQPLANVDLVVPNNTILITWDGPSMIDQDMTDFSVDVPGIYVATVTTDNNCVTLDSVEVILDADFPIIDVMSSSIIDCNNETVTLSGSSDMNGSTYQWTSPNSEVFNNESIDVSQAGTYDLVVTAPNLCMVDTFIVVEVDTLLPTIVTGPDPLITCADGKVTLEIETTTNIITYEWEGPDNYEADFVDPLAILPGIYTVTVTNDLGCSSFAEINVIDDTNGPEIMVRDTFITCDLIAVPLPLDTNDDEVSYTWDGPGFVSELQNPETNVLGQYFIYAISDRNECVTLDTLNVTYLEVPPVFGFESSIINCYQPQTTLKAIDADDDLSVTWTDTDFNILGMDSLIVNMADSFQLIVVGVNTCADTIQVTVDENLEMADAEILNAELFQCLNVDINLEGNIIDANGIDDFSATWTTNNGIVVSGDQTFDAIVSGEGTYFLTVTNLVNGCESVDSIDIVRDPQALIGITLEEKDPNCLGFQDGSISIVNIDGGFGPYQYILDNQMPQSDSIFSNLSSGSYTVQVIDSIGCTIDVVVDLLDGLDFMATAELETTIIVGDSINLQSVFNIPDEEVASISWTAHNSDFGCDDCFEPLVTPLINTYYTLSATSMGGCEDASQVLIRVDRNPQIDVANVFAPGSESNGLFYIQQTRGIDKVLSMSVFDKWASRMFFVENVNPADPSAGWDGTYRGQDVNPGVYVVVVEILLYSGEIITYASDITVLR